MYVLPWPLVLHLSLPQRRLKPNLDTYVLATDRPDVHFTLRVPDDAPERQRRPAVDGEGARRRRSGRRPVGAAWRDPFRDRTRHPGLARARHEPAGELYTPSMPWCILSPDAGVETARRVSRSAICPRGGGLGSRDAQPCWCDPLTTSPPPSPTPSLLCRNGGTSGSTGNVTGT